jgi:plasmid maintenance system antidote protein VapI
MEANQYIDILISLYNERKERNQKYSKRALARDLNINAGDLISILKGKKSITPKIAYKIGIHIGHSDKSLMDFISPTLL